ncbi:DUF2147 domain-containing protein [Lacinutrix undariae]
MKHLYIVLIIAFSFTSQAQTITGQWETFDDETKEKKAVIEIYEDNDLYFAKIVKSYTSKEGAVCNNCNGEQKGKPIVGLVIIENLKADDDEYNDGTIMDPENGKTYKCYIEFVNDNKLKVRGYLGVALFGRTQYWTRKQ